MICNSRAKEGASVGAFSLVLDALKFVGSAASGLAKLGDEKRKKFADICDRISEVLREFLEALEKGLPPIDLCAELREYVTPIRTIASGAVSSKEIDDLATELEHLCDTWARIATEAQSGGHTVAVDREEITIAKGRFKGLAKRLRSM
jgi:hypothetical protein